MLARRLLLWLMTFFIKQMVKHAITDADSGSQTGDGSDNPEPTGVKATHQWLKSLVRGKYSD